MTDPDQPPAEPTPAEPAPAEPAPAEPAAAELPPAARALLMSSYTSPPYVQRGKRILFAEEGIYVATLQRIESFGRPSKFTGVLYFTAVFQIDDVRFSGLQLDGRITHGPPGHLTIDGHPVAYKALDLVQAVGLEKLARVMRDTVHAGQELRETDVRTCVGRTCGIEVKHGGFSNEPTRMTAFITNYFSLEECERRLARNEHRWPPKYSIEAMLGSNS